METVILYAYYETDKTIFNLNFYSKVGIVDNDKYLYIIVINGEQCSVELPKYNNVVILKRPNTGFDFGAHAFGLQWLNNKYGNILPFKYYMFLNCSVAGPFLPTYYPKELHWTNAFISKITNNIKLVGTTISCLPAIDSGGYGPKVCGYCFATDNIGLNLLINSGTIFKEHDSKFNAIMAEYGISTIILNNGYTIDCLLYKYQNIDWYDKQNWKIYENIFPDRQNTYDGISIHPFEVIFHKWYWAHHQNNLIFYDYCKKYTQWNMISYPNK